MNANFVLLQWLFVLFFDLTFIKSMLNLLLQGYQSMTYLPSDLIVRFISYYLWLCKYNLYKGCKSKSMIVKVKRNILENTYYILF